MGLALFREVAAIARQIAVLTLLMIMVAGLVFTVQASEDVSVEAVQVTVSSSTVPPPARVAKRMENSVVTVGEHVLLGRKISDVEANKAAYEKLIKEVFDRVLVGYSVQEVTITPAASAQIAVVIAPWGDVVREVKLDIDYGGLSPEIVELIKQDTGDLADKINNVLLGMPIDAVDWAGGVSKSIIRETLADKLPEFRANMEITSGQVATVKLALAPIGPLVQDATVTVRSRSLPNMLLLDARPAVEEAAFKLRGLPVAFVERHTAYFREMLRAAGAKHSVAQRFGLDLTVLLNAGPRTEVVVGAETTRYNISLEGYLDMGRRQDDTSIRLHVGRYLSKTDELFLETTFIPGTVSWEFVPGWGHRLSARTEVGVKYNFSSEVGLLWLRQDLGGNWSFRAERTPLTGRNELGLRYKLHEFLSAEYVFTKDDKWLRLVGNL